MSDSTARLADLETALTPAKNRLLGHPLYDRLGSADDLRLFMREHVFAVWDFMSLLKRLQREVCCIELPWQPPTRPALARFVNEIVLGEESDVGPDGEPRSHFDLYRLAMTDLNAETAPIDSFLRDLSTGRDWRTSLFGLPIEEGTRTFVTKSLSWAEGGTIEEVAAAFCFGREDIIPEMFERLIPSLSAEGADVGLLRYYLDRHIELDGDEHGPLARRLIAELCEDDPDRWQRATAAAREAIEARIGLWDGILAHLGSTHESTNVIQPMT